ncbi:hypothetical protein V8G54_008968, partial [Vigna mungo]
TIYITFFIVGLAPDYLRCHIHVCSCFSGEGHLVIVQEPRVTKIRHSHMQRIVQEDVAGLQVTMNDLGLLFVEVLHGLGYFQGPHHPLFEGREWRCSVFGPFPRPM